MMAWLHAHGEAIAQTLHQFWRRPVAAFLSIAVIGVGLLFPVGGYLVVANLKALAGGAGTDPQISVFLAPDTGSLERAEIERRLRVEPGVRNFRFISKNAALEEIQSRTGSRDLMAGLAGNPLPDTYLVTPRQEASVAQARLADSIRAWPNVAEVDGNTVWSDRLRVLVDTGHIAVLGLGIVLGFAMLAISFNTVRLQVLTRTEEVAVLRLFGATTSYIRRPFLYFGALQGLAAALFAWVVASGSLLWVEPRVASLLDAYGVVGRLAGLTATDGLALSGFSALVGLLGSWLASAEH